MSITLFVEEFDDHGAASSIHGFPRDLENSSSAFLDQIRGLDSCVDMSGDLQITLARHGCLLEWEHEVNQHGGRFRLFFWANTTAFRTFCLLCHDWITDQFPFSESIVGVRTTLTGHAFSWTCEVWVRDGFRAANVEPRWQDILGWLSGRTGIREDLALAMQMGFRLHPTYRRYRAEASAVRKEANEIPPFAACVDRALGRDGPRENPRPVFDLAVATTYKRKWSERRLPRNVG
jgi:hypothetical protein